MPDAGTYWYHPHQRGFEQVGRGLYGPLIIEERQPIQVGAAARIGEDRLGRENVPGVPLNSRHSISASKGKADSIWQT